MLCRDLQVVNLNITEDNYEYKALFRLCTGDACMDIDLESLSVSGTLDEIKTTFSIDESIDEIKDTIMQKVMEASKIESKISQGENCCEEEVDIGVQRNIDSLSIS